MIVKDEDFINKCWIQKNGDSILVLEKFSPKKGEKSKWRGIFQKYPYAIFADKQTILKGYVGNPQIEQVEFVQKIWPQNCGDSLRVIEKTDKRQNSTKKYPEYLWKCEFINHPCIIYSVKTHIIEGCVDNPQIEKEELINKIWPQSYSEELKVIEKTNIKKDQRYLWRCQFLKYPCEILAISNDIKEGYLINPNLPWKSKENLEKYIQENFKEKPTIEEISKSLNIAVSTIGHYLNKYELLNIINYCPSSNKEDELFVFIKSLNADAESNNWSILKNQEIDIYIPNLKLGFEFNGNYWHSELFKESNYHQKKSLLAQEKEISLVHIWEWEWVLKKEIIKSLIKSKLGIFEKKIPARKCIIRELQNKEYQDFCEENHLQGTCGAKVKLGLYYKDELIQIMSFGVPRFTNDYEWEIIRECSKQGYFVLGGKEKLWKYFIKNYNPKNCISYCDFSKFNGNSYLKLGFKKERLNKPGFWWVNGIEVILRSPTKHQELKDKYNKLYDCGQLVFTWFK